MITFDRLLDLLFHIYNKLNRYIESLNICTLDCLFVYVLFYMYVLLKLFTLIWWRQPLQVNITTFRPMLNAQGLWERRDLYRAISTVIRDLGFSVLIRPPPLFSSILRHTMVCRGFVLIRILYSTLSLPFLHLRSYSTFIRQLYPVSWPL
jgi:hypothetical protein